MNKPKLSITLVTPGMPFDGNTDKERSLGGSETMGLMMGRELARLEHRVTHFTNTDRPSLTDGVQYIPLGGAPRWLSDRPNDVVIAQRTGKIFGSPLPMASKVRILWHHDLAIHRQQSDIMNGAWNTTEHLVLSEYQKDQFNKVYGFPLDAMHVTRNGIDEDLIRSVPVSIAGREQKLLFYSARPERGLLHLLESIMPKIWEKDPEVRLAVAGYDNTVPQLADMYNRCYGIIDRDPRLENLGYMPKANYYEMLAKATAYVYPTEFEEISCITAMECQALGVPIIHTGVAALAETIKPGFGIQVNKPDKGPKDAGIWTNPAWQREFADAVLSYLGSKTDETKDEGSDSLQAKIRRDNTAKITNQVDPDERARRDTALSNFSMRTLGQEWEDMIFGIFDRVNDCPLRLAKHFHFRSEIDGAREVHDRASKSAVTGSLSKAKSDLLMKDFAEIKLETSFDHIEEYDRTGGDEARHLWQGVINGPRLRYLIKWIQEAIAGGKIPEDFKLLDFGAGFLGYCVTISNAFPKAKIFGTDISEPVLKLGEQIVKDHAEHPDRIAWFPGSDKNDDFLIPMKKHLGQDPDIVLAMEVIEHVPDATETLEFLDKITKPGGYIQISTPWGPWESMSDTFQHLREIEEADLYDMVGHKRDFQSDYLVGGRHNETGDPLGFYFWWWTKVLGTNPVGQVEMDRKVKIQNPRRTVSVCMITKNAEDLVLRTLKSIAPLALEIIVVDQGSTDKTREFLEEYGATILDSDPAVEVGFATVRNQSIENAVGDMVLWIDSDEMLCNRMRIYKYLQANAFEAYQMRQVHFTVEPPPGTLKPDLPARLFRNNNEMKFFGFVHEHPEKAINKGPGYTIVLSDMDIAHDGYLTEVDRRDRFERNINLMMRDRRENPDRVLGRFLMVRDWVQGSRWRLQNSNGMMDPVTKGYLEDAVREVEEHLIRPGPHIKELMAYYSEANSYLKRGIKYRIGVDVHDPQDQNGQPPEFVDIVTDKKEVLDQFVEAVTEPREKVLKSPYY